MGTKADFYMENYDKIVWIGSKKHNGNPLKIPVNILIQVNPIMFEEMILDFLHMSRDDSFIREDGDKWPWIWSDSYLTDYSYIFTKERVFAYSPSIGNLFDPLKFIQGESIENSFVPYSIKFPTMQNNPSIVTDITQEKNYKHGLQSAKAV
ncbi:MAG: hypothetical protein DRN27_09870 [Thermoplasmata archaeon]|nr:MAG: hypothetical protein DRN27_09870 [Thermoplasmata archaeon]